MTRAVPAAFSRYGGKHAMLPVIIPLLPAHECWLEAFAGAAWVTLAKPPAALETLNDLDDGVVNFYRVLRSPDQLSKLQALLEQTPYARAEMTACRGTWPAAADPVEKARAWFVTARMCVNGSPHAGGWSQSHQRGSWAISKWQSAIAGLPAVHERLKNVQIEHKDWRPLLGMHNAKDCLLYADPPYVLSTREGSDRYEHELTDQDHRDLVTALLDWRGQAVVSGYAHPIYAPLEKHGWKRIDTDVHCSSTANRPTARTRRRQESLWLNYDPNVVRGQMPLWR